VFKSSEREPFLNFTGDFMTESELEKKETTEVKDTPPEANNQEGEDEASRNWKAVRERRQEEERLRKEQEKKIAEQQEMIKALEAVIYKSADQGQTQQQPSQIHPDEWVTGQKLQEILEQERQQWQKTQQELKQQQTQAQVQAQMATKYPDYKQVLSADNLSYLEYHDPEIAAGIAQIQDPYIQAVTAYKQIKSFVPQMTPQDQKKIERTQNTPTTHAAPSTYEAEGGGRITKERKKQLYEEMLRYSR
jgi:hypothetical protein